MIRAAAWITLKGITLGEKASLKRLHMLVIPLKHSRHDKIVVMENRLVVARVRDRRTVRL